MEIYNIVGIAIILPFTVLYAVYRTDPRYLIGIALVLLVSAALEDAAGNAFAANDIAIVSYYCLVAGVILMIADGYIESHKGGRTVQRIRSAASALKSRVLSDSRFRMYSARILPVVVFAVLAGEILSPFLSPGYVLVTDMVFGPRAPVAGLYGFSPFLGGGSALTALQVAADSIMPGWVIQKVFLFLIFFLSGYSMYAFTGREMGPARYYASFLYMVNPFIYARMLAGAWALMFAYALLPLAFLSFIRLTSGGGANVRTFRNSFLAASLFTIVSVFDIHTFALLVFLAILYCVASAAFKGRSWMSFTRALAIPLLMFASMFMLFNLYWLVASPGSSGSILGGFTFLDAIAFASRPTILNNTMLSVAAMYGFFRSGYAYPTDVYPWLLSLFILFLFLAVFGVLSNWRHRTRGPLVLCLAAALVISIALATGISSPLTSGLYTYLFNNLPFFNGFREPQKFVAIAVLAYSYLGALGIYEIEQYLRGSDPARTKKMMERTVEIASVVIIIVALISPFAYSYMEINGFNGQLTNVQYPQSWYRAESIMAGNSTDYSVLVLPWHTYMYYNWSGTKFASPFNQFFTQNVISGGTNSYVGGEGAIQSGTDEVVVQALAQRGNITHFGNIISLLDAKYVFLTKSADYQDYSFLYSQADLRLVLNSSECALFVNEHPVSRAYIVHAVRHVPSYSQLINLSSTVNLTQYAWIMGGTGSTGVSPYYLPVQSRMLNHAAFSLSVPGLLAFNSTSYLVFIPPAGNPFSWTSGLVPYFIAQNVSDGGAEGLQPYSIFTVSGGPGTVTVSFAPYRNMQFSYAASGISFLFASALLTLTFFPEQLRQFKKAAFRMTGKQK